MWHVPVLYYGGNGFTGSNKRMRLTVALAGLVLALLPRGSGSASMIGAPAPTTPTDQILVLNQADDTYQGWISISSSEEEDGPRPTITRVRGDGFSRFYYLISLDTDEVRDEAGTLLARVDQSSTGLGVRKTPSRLTFILYHVSTTGLSRYHLVTVERGKALVHACRLDRATFESAAQQHFPTMAALAAAQSHLANYVIDLLQETEPVLTHCVAVDNGVPRGKPDRQPVLTIAFPHVGGTFVNDGGGFKGGWLYGGYDEFGPGRRHCCSFVYHGEDRDAVIIGERLHPKREIYRVRSIFYLDGFARQSLSCDIGDDHAIVAVADSRWENGRAYLSDGKALRIVRWTDKAPKGCDYWLPLDPGPRETMRDYEEWVRNPTPPTPADRP
jgi:hypothetical protein